MTPEFLIFLMIGAAAGGFVNGLAGFGTALFALGWWSEVMPPQEAVPLVLVFSVLGGLPGAWEVRREIDWRDMARYLLPAAIGAPLGLALLSAIDVVALKRLVGLFLLGFGLYFALRRALPTIGRPTPLADAGVGFAGGLLGGLAGLSGAAPLVWSSLKPWAKRRRRAFLQPFNLVVLGGLMLWFLATGAYDGQSLLRIAVAFPVTLICVRLGILAFRRLDDAQYRALIVAMMILTGAMVLLRA